MAVYGILSAAVVVAGLLLRRAREQDATLRSGKWAMAALAMPGMWPYLVVVCIFVSMLCVVLRKCVVGVLANS